MPVKVRCKACGQAVVAPDKARGKAIKCKKCGKAVKVPAAVKKKADSVDADSDAFLQNINLDRVEDRNVEVCPSCGAEIPDDDDVTECYECGFDLTQQTVSRTRDKSSSGPKGPNTSAFYERLWGDSFGFANRHIGLAVFTSILTMICIPLAGFCGLLVYTWPQIPLKFFFALVGTVALLMPLGWIGHVHLMTVEKTLKKSAKLGKVKFDFAMSAALGVKLIGWFLVFSLPFLIIFGGIGWVLSQSGTQYALQGALGLVVLCILPLMPAAMSHLAMPVQYRAWLLPSIVPNFLATIGPSIAWLMVTVLLVGPLVGGVIGTVVWKENDLRVFQGQADRNASIFKTILDAEWKGEEPPSDLGEPEDYTWNAWMYPGIAVIVASLFLGYTTLVVARVNGLYTFFCKSGLDLITAVPEVQWVQRGGKDRPVLSIKRSYPAGHGKRLAALLIDGFMVTLIGAIVGAIIGMVGMFLPMGDPKVFLAVVGAAYLAGIIVNAIYFINQHSGMDQATFGKKSMGLFVCDMDGNPIGTGTAILRWIVWQFSIGLTGGLGALCVFFNPDNRSIHDFACGTMVREIKPIRVKKKKKKAEDGD